MSVVPPPFEHSPPRAPLQSAALSRLAITERLEEEEDAQEVGFCPSSQVDDKQPAEAEDEEEWTVREQQKGGAELNTPCGTSNLARGSAEGGRNCEFPGEAASSERSGDAAWKVFEDIWSPRQETKDACLLWLLLPCAFPCSLITL